ncbi:Vitamin K-dependent gamma-carboxylase [Maioricimonas rarisocia]|uniref:Vitamin K-dependent gamma-carboxylase n=1 Tax=Maioricimonas rarisocia TaxID=2528026 RepID=A0A517Z5P7_9PLAN|nr:HTTM domain-containing protein [Maioricimonas rarisocia]QDU37820.1 Vitamin K-dependent gamma-carboxylase [Maioricimonas rarisocia]
MHESATRDGLCQRLGRFFHAEETPYGLALMRMVLPPVLLVAALPRAMHVREIYSSDGAAAPLWENYGLPDMLPVPSGAVAVALYALMIFCLLSTMVGWQTRLSLLVAALLYPYFGMLDSVSTLTKYTVVASHALVILCCSRCGAVWSVDAWLAGRRQWNPLTAQAPRFPAWPRRLLQLLVGLIYLGAAITKMHTPAYFSGDQLTYWMLTEANFDNPVGEYLSLFPAIILVVAYLTIVWEILFLFVAWRGTARIVMLGMGLCFHFMTWATLGLIVFPMVYCALYLAFIDEQDVAWAAVRLRRLQRRVLPVRMLPQWRWSMSGAADPSRSWATYGIAAAALVLVAIEAERRSDPFGIARPEGRHQLQPLPAERVRELMVHDRPLRPVDKLFSFDVGTMAFGGVLVDRCRTFQHGERAIVQCSVQHPHEDMWVGVDLLDADGRIVHQGGQILPRETLRTSIFYDFSQALAAGEYWFVLRFDGHEVSRRQIHLGEGSKGAESSDPAFALR